jgi:hypothetical protein
MKIDFTKKAMIFNKFIEYMPCTGPKLTKRFLKYSKNAGTAKK